MSEEFIYQFCQNFFPYTPKENEIIYFVMMPFFGLLALYLVCLLGKTIIQAIKKRRKK